MIEFAFTKNAILVAVNAEKILKANDEIKDIINRNIGYPDGVGAVWALEKKRDKGYLKKFLDVSYGSILLRGIMK